MCEKRPLPGWTLCSERMPETSKPVLYVGKKGAPYVGRRCKTPTDWDEDAREYRGVSWINEVYVTGRKRSAAYAVPWAWCPIPGYDYGGDL